MTEAILSNTVKIEEAWPGQKAYVAWGTVGLFVSIVLGTLMLINGLVQALISPWQAIPFSTVIIYLSFTVLHEAGHKNIVQGIRWMQPLERAMGWLCGMVFIIIPFSLFARLHDHHHAHTNDPDRDPDYWVSADSWLLASLKSLVLPVHYIMIGLSKSQVDVVFKRTRTSAILYWVLMVILLAYLVNTGWGEVILIAWLLPIVLASFILAMLFDWIPHRPNIQQSRYQNTRIYLAPLANLLTLGQSYHLIHHLNPRIPWYAYKRVFNQVRGELEINNAPIEGLSDSKLPRLFKAQSIATPDNRVGKYTFTVRAVGQETAQAVSITFDDSETEGFRFKAGQYITINKLINHQWITRCYSIAGSI